MDKKHADEIAAIAAGWKAADARKAEEAQAASNRLDEFRRRWEDACHNVLPKAMMDFGQELAKHNIESSYHRLPNSARDGEFSTMQFYYGPRNVKNPSVVAFAPRQVGLAIEAKLVPEVLKLPQALTVMTIDELTEERITAILVHVLKVFRPA